MDERDFDLLDTLGSTGNITRAADQLFLTQSALSKRIQSVERELGVQLFLRSRQGVRFTPEGEIVLNACHDIVESLKQMRQKINGAHGQICGTLNAGVSLNYALYCLPDVLIRFRERYPHVDLNITTGESRRLIGNLQNGSVDLAILRGEYPWDGKRVLLSRESICVICNSEDADKDLHELPYIARQTDPDLERAIARWLRENNIRPHANSIHVDNIRTCVEMVSSGLGWGIVPEICLRNFTGCIRPVRFSNGEPFVRSTYLMYNEAVEDLPQVRAFIELLQQDSASAEASDL